MIELIHIEILFSFLCIALAVTAWQLWKTTQAPVRVRRELIRQYKRSDDTRR